MVRLGGGIDFTNIAIAIYGNRHERRLYCFIAVQPAAQDVIANQVNFNVDVADLNKERAVLRRDDVIKREDDLILGLILIPYRDIGAVRLALSAAYAALGVNSPEALVRP